MAEDSSVQTLIVLQPVTYPILDNQPYHHSHIIQDMTNLSFTPKVAIQPRPSNLPSDICTISSGLGNLRTDFNSMPSLGGGYSACASNAMATNYAPNVGVQTYQHAPDHVTYSQYHNGSIFSVPKSWPREHKEDLVVTVYGLVKTLLGASGTNHGAIDNRIEQAMDLVKSHLMNAVRSEVEELKEKIIRLEDTIINLQGENEVLKRNVPSDVLRQISNTTTPLLAVQQQQQQPTASTALANVGGNQIVQQQSPTTVHPTATLANTTVLSTGVTQVPPTQTNVAPPQTVNVANPPNVVSGVANNQGVANNNTPSQMAPTYMPQSTSQHVATVNNQVSAPKPPQ